MAVRIRPYRPADLEPLIALFQAAVRQTARRDYSEAQIRAWAPDEIDRAAWAERRAGRQTWVATFEGAVAGFADLEPDGRVDMLFVDPAYQRRGIASALLAVVEAAAREGGLARLYTEASITARPVFERRGFRIVAPQTVCLRGQDFTNYRMERVLR